MVNESRSATTLIERSLFEEMILVQLDFCNSITRHSAGINKDWNNPNGTIQLAEDLAQMLGRSDPQEYLQRMGATDICF